MPRITEISKLVRGIKGHTRIIFDRLYDIREYTGDLVLPEQIRGWVTQRFGDPVTVERQKIIKITNKVTLEGTLFNDLRSKRPLSRNEDRKLDELIEEYGAGCPFCNVELRTPEDIFGRLSGLGAVTASNVAKYDRWHGLIIPKEHNPLCFSADQVGEYFALANKWFAQVAKQLEQEKNSETQYPFLMWNCLWPAGSSVVHGHLQVTVTGGMHYPRIELLRQTTQSYQERYGINYFDDLYKAHQAIGLARDLGKFFIITSLTPIKDKEVWVVMRGETDLDNLSMLGLAVGKVLASLKEDGTTSFNVAVYLPPLVPAVESWSNFPILARIVDRGDALGRTADFGGMELYAASVVSSDPFSLANKIKDISI